MEFRHLRYFVVLAEELHFGRAAKRLNISQPPLSLNIKQLENSLGAELFERNNHSVKLTPAGEKFKELASELLKTANLATRQIKDIAQGLTSRIRIGFVGSMMFRNLSEQLLKFQKKYPHVQFELKEMNSSDQINAFNQGLIDIGFVHTERIPNTLKYELLSSETFVCCVSKNHPLAKTKKFDVNLLKNDPLIIFSRGASPDYFEKVLGLCAELGIDPITHHEVRHWLSVVALVRKGLGIALVPQALKNSGIDLVEYIPTPKSTIESQVFLLWNEKSKSNMTHKLLEHLRSK